MTQSQPPSKKLKGIQDGNNKTTLYICFEAYTYPPKTYLVRSVSINSLFNSLESQPPELKLVLQLGGDDDLALRKFETTVDEPRGFEERFDEQRQYALTGQEGVNAEGCTPSDYLPPVRYVSLIPEYTTPREDMGFGKFMHNLVLTGGQNVTAFSPGRMYSDTVDWLMEYSKKIYLIDTTDRSTILTPTVSHMNSPKNTQPLVVEAYGKLYVISQAINVSALLQLHMRQVLDHYYMKKRLPQQDQLDFPSDLQSIIMDPWMGGAFEAYDPVTGLWESLPPPPFLGKYFGITPDYYRFFLMPDLGYAVINGKIFVSIPSKKNLKEHGYFSYPCSFRLAIGEHWIPPEVLEKGQPEYSCFSYDVEARKWDLSSMFDSVGPCYGFTNQAFVFADDILICVCLPVIPEVYAYKLVGEKVVDVQSLTEGFGITKFTVSTHLADVGEGYFCLVRNDLDDSDFQDVKVKVTLILFYVERAGPAGSNNGFLDCKIAKRFEYIYPSNNHKILLEVRGCCAM